MCSGVWKGWTQIKEQSFWEDGEEWRSHCTRGSMLRETSMNNYADFQLLPDYMTFYPRTQNSSPLMNEN
jgi:hypothetical protein